ncbi:hypothetical protein IAU60_001231 [Kwoniella sp. DSM 27419]
MPLVPPMETLPEDRESLGRASSSHSSGRPAAPAGQVDKRAVSSTASTSNGNGGAGVKDKGWIEGVDYAYEYVPVSQRREGRKNM